ncbi:MAG: ankyrin repeat domain-containing protein [Planctomycetaceae bacterium]|nr:ankyrin repeat domain-containing protein [Planctomycetales bacterium]MCB9923392.1 ankyrin repeat domain-containing protein [Planctomycetaceae bacterium]
MFYIQRLFISVLIASVSLVTGCSVVTSEFESTWHERCRWIPENYFSDEKVIALCHAIEADDLKEIDRLVAAGADVNAKGKGNMTPLLWAFPDNKPERFKRLLEHGADPNVMVTDDFNTRSAIKAGDSITHMSARTWFPDHFKYVMQHGGDANLVHPEYESTPLFSVIEGSGRNKEERVRLLIEKGADLNRKSLGATPAMQAVSWFGQYRIALMLLEAGADPTVYASRQEARLIHMVVFSEKRVPIESEQQKQDRAMLIAWLEQHGESFAAAREDAARWAGTSSKSPTELKELRRAEIAARHAREAAERQLDAGGNVVE